MLQRRGLFFFHNSKRRANGTEASRDAEKGERALARAHDAFVRVRKRAGLHVGGAVDRAHRSELLVRFDGLVAPLDGREHPAVRVRLPQRATERRLKGADPRRRRAARRRDELAPVGVAEAGPASARHNERLGARRRVAVRAEDAARGERAAKGWQGAAARGRRGEEQRRDGGRPRRGVASARRGAARAHRRARRASVRARRKLLVPPSGLRRNIARGGERRGKKNKGRGGGGNGGAMAAAPGVDGAAVGTTVGDAEVEADPANPTDALLFRALATTSLYEPVEGDASERRVATLSAANPTYAVYPADSVDVRSDVDGAPEIVVQVRKRGGKAQLLIDGFVSEGVEDPKSKNVWTHNLTWHRGLHGDDETGTRVFSPIAVVAAVEDGQHAFQNVTVAVVRQFARRGVPNKALPETVLSETRLVGHRVDEARCRVVRVPYPLSYPPPPTITIFDNVQRQKRMVTTKLSNVGELFALLATVAQGDWAKGATNALSYKEQLFSAIVAVSPLLPISAITGGAIYFGWLKTAVAGLALAKEFYDTNSITNVDERAVKQVGGLLRVASSTILRLQQMPKIPPIRSTRFSLSELTAAIEAIAMKRDMPGDDEPIDTDVIHATGQDEQFRREEILWNWLHGDDSTSELAQADTSRLVVNDKHAVQIRLRISVDDALGCAGTATYHEIRCEREDNCLLGAAAAGTLEELNRLYYAVTKLQETLEEALQDRPGADQVFTGRYWFDWAYYNAQFYGKLFNEKWKRFRDNTESAGPLLWKALRDSMSVATTILDNRRNSLKAVVQGLNDKLAGLLFEPGSPGASLLERIEDALASKRCPVPPNGHWVRTLPQRATASGARTLYSASADDSAGHLDVQMQGVFTRVFSEYNDASKWFATSMASGALALRRYVREWEASSATRIRLVCVCAPGRELMSVPRLTPPAAHGTLALTTPPDMLFAGAVAVATEDAQRRIRLVVERKRTAPQKSALEALGLAHSDASLLACQVFGELWVDELLALWALGDSTQAEMLEQASFRASERLGAAGELLLNLLVTQNPSTTLSSDTDDVAPDRTDPSLVATQAGRDAGLLLDRSLFGQNYVAVRVAMTPFLRDAARAAVRAAQAFARAVPTALPHEPIAALLHGHQVDGVAAFVRIRRAAGDDAAVVQAATAAYPSTRLLPPTGGAWDDAQQERYEDEAKALGTPQLPDRRGTTVRALLETARFRLAGLRMDVETGSATPTTTIGALAERLGKARLSAPGASFYVPFGFGDAHPAPTLPPCAAPMFGSVPVFGDALTDALRRGRPNGVALARALRIRLKPSFGCLVPLKETRDAGQAESVHPNVVQVVRSAVQNEVTVHYSASRAPDGRASRPSADGAVAVAAAVARAKVDATAKAHVRSEATVELAAAVASLAWNAERVVQAVMAALASAATDDFGAVELSLTVPPDDRGGSPWYTRPENPIALAQKKRLVERRVDIGTRVLDMVAGSYEEGVAKLVDEIEYLIKTSIGNWRVEHRNAVEFFRTKQMAFKQRGKDADWHALAIAAQDALEALLTDETLQVYYSERNKDRGNVSGLAPISDTEKAKFVASVQKRRASLRVRVDAMGRTQGRLRVAQQRVAQQRAAESVGAADADETKKVGQARQRHALVGALGVGMAMLVPLVGDALALRCGTIDAPGADAMRDAAADDAVRAAFAADVPLRLSEACLVVHSRTPTT